MINNVSLILDSDFYFRDAVHTSAVVDGSVSAKRVKNMNWKFSILFVAFLMAFGAFAAMGVSLPAQAGVVLGDDDPSTAPQNMTTTCSLSEKTCLNADGTETGKVLAACTVSCDGSDGVATCYAGRCDDGSRNECTCKK